MQASTYMLKVSYPGIADFKRQAWEAWRRMLRFTIDDLVTGI